MSSSHEQDPPKLDTMDPLDGFTMEAIDGPDRLYSAEQLDRIANTYDDRFEYITFFENHLAKPQNAPFPEPASYPLVQVILANLKVDVLRDAVSAYASFHQVCTQRLVNLDRFTYRKDIVTYGRKMQIRLDQMMKSLKEDPHKSDVNEDIVAALLYLKFAGSLAQAAADTLPAPVGAQNRFIFTLGQALGCFRDMAALRSGHFIPQVGQETGLDWLGAHQSLVQVTALTKDYVLFHASNNLLLLIAQYAGLIGQGSGAKGAPVTMPSLYSWGSSLPVEFTKQLNQGNPIALMTLGHWLVCTPSLDKFWWGRGWRARMIPLISHDIGTTYEPMFQWCRDWKQHKPSGGAIM